MFAFCSPDRSPLASFLPKALGSRGPPAQNLCRFLHGSDFDTASSKEELCAGAPTPAGTKRVSSKQRADVG